MKIIGFIDYNGRTEMVLKGDSCLLNGRKPMFIPDWTEELYVTPCLILRVSRLGKEIAWKYAGRYYDATAPGADFVAMDKWREAVQAGNPWTKAIAFDYSLAIGEWSDVQRDDVLCTKDTYVMTPEKAIVEASKLMTIRQGDLIYIQQRNACRPAKKEEIIRAEINGEEKLYCKIK